MKQLKKILALSYLLVSLSLVAQTTSSKKDTEVEKKVKEVVPKKSIATTPFKDSPMPELKGKDDTYLIFNLKTEFHSALLFSARRAFKKVKSDKNIRAVIIRMNTYGGSVMVLKQIMHLIHKCDVPVYLYIEKNALSAGALLSFACQGVYMNPASTIGAAAVVQGGGQDVPKTMKSKIDSAMRADIRNAAQLNGYRQEVGEAMIDMDLELKIGDEMICPSGELLTMTAKEATAIKSDGKALHSHGIVKDVKELAILKGLNPLKEIELKMTQQEKIASFILSFASILMIVAMMGIFIEMQTPGFGIPGVVGVLAFVIIIYANIISSQVHWIQYTFIFIGIILVTVEILIPGFGVCGITGICSILIGVFCMLLPFEFLIDVIKEADMPEFSKSNTIVNHIAGPLLQTAIGLTGTIFFAFLFNRYLPKTSFGRKMVLSHSMSTEEGYSGTLEEVHQTLVGKIGKASSDFNPSGIGIFDGKRVDVIAYEHIDKDSDIEIIRVEGSKTYVRAVSNSTEAES
ncbi:MAG: hypothetical protein HRT89_18600 [Lentisphaeria bacterium]|nr:hypothetical protein [Lentisphaeria bacterium]NQZ70068.1 hypothetical protein [Lentisphaeria bacterium]